MANFYIRTAAHALGSGTGTGLTPDKYGTTAQTYGNNSLTVAGGNFSADDVNKVIKIGDNTGTSFNFYRVNSYVNPTQITLNQTIGSMTNRHWGIGGATNSIAKLLLPQTIFSPLVAGDVIHVGSGVYREVINIGMSFAGSQVKLRGDVDGVFTGDPPGEVRITNYLTDDKSAPSTSPVFTIAANRNFWAFENLHFVIGNSRLGSWGDSTDITFKNCAVISLYGTQSQTGISHIFTTAAAHNITYDSCRFFMGAGISFTLPTSATADYDANVVIKNCTIQTQSNTCIPILTSGALAFKGGGVYVYNNLLQASSSAVTSTGSNISQTYPVRVENNFLIAAGSALSGGTIGQMVEDYNIFASTTSPRSNVTAGVNSSIQAASLIHFGQEVIWGGQTRPFGSPGAGSPLLNFGNSASSGVPTVDSTGVPRSVGTVGPYERTNAWTKETTTTRSGVAAISITGPGYHDFTLPVDAAATTVSVWVRWDSTYAGTKPSLTVTNSTQEGVSETTVTATGSANTWEQLTLNFTPTAKGTVTIRLRSATTALTGEAFADDWSVS